MKITAEDLFCAVNNAKDKYIDEAADDDKEEITPILNAEVYQAVRRNSILSYASMAAVLVLIIALAIIIPSLANKPQTAPETSARTEKTVYPIENVEEDFPLFDLENGQYVKELDAEIGAPVYAVVSGTVVYEEYYDAENGNVLVIKDNNSNKYVTLTNLDFNLPYQLGDNVKKGDIVGYVEKPFVNKSYGLIYAVYENKLPEDKYGENSLYYLWKNSDLAPSLEGRKDFDFDNRNPYITVEAAKGEKVYSPQDGKIMLISESGELGKVVGISFCDGGINVFFFNLEQLSSDFKVGDIIKRGREIGKVGGNDLGYYVIAN